MYWKARTFCKIILQGADELIFMDVVASLYERNSFMILFQIRLKKFLYHLPLIGSDPLKISEMYEGGADKYKYCSYK